MKLTTAFFHRRSALSNPRREDFPSNLKTLAVIGIWISDPSAAPNLSSSSNIASCSATEFGFETTGGLVLPCKVSFFKEILRFMEKDERRFGKLSLDEFLKMVTNAVGFDSARRRLPTQQHRSLLCRKLGIFREIEDFEIGSVNYEVGSGGRTRHGEGFGRGEALVVVVYEGFVGGENAGRLLLLPLVDPPTVPSRPSY
ncbi:hypothetical protein ACLB2K_062618 [Fragaria x ananassa]